MKNIILVVVANLALVSHAYAEDNAFSEGKNLFQNNCLTCHNAQLDPPQAPPMFGVQMKYKNVTPNKTAFVSKITSFVMHPTEEKALLKHPVQILDLMPDLGFERSDVKKISSYIYDESFSPPCNHWKAAAKRFKENGNLKQYRNHQKRYDMRCQQQKKNSMLPASGTSLKAIMQQLDRDYNKLTYAILLADFDSAAEAANGVANHDKAPMAQKKKLKQALGEKMKGFKQADMKVHALAMSIKKAAKAKDMQTLIQRHSQMLGACMSCHSTYRSKALQILK